MTMLARAVEKYIRMSPRKVRYVIDPVRSKTVAQALNILSLANRRACGPVTKAIQSAFANARQKDATLTEDQVVIERIFADGGPSWKRFRAAAFGRAVQILKRTSHLTVELERSTNGHGVTTVQPGAQPETKDRPKRGGARRAPSKPAGRRKAAAGDARKPAPTKRRTATKKG
jgi:large subunit ribosomal protein L22